MDEFEVALKAVKLAGDYLKKKDNPTINSSIGKDIKLSADIVSEQILIDVLAETKIPIISEEAGEISGETKEYIWIIDPLDGTANYWRGMKELACVSVALWKGDEPILGAIYRFEQDELFSGIVGDGAYLNGKPIHTSVVSKVKDAFIATGFPVKADYGEEHLQMMISNVQRFKKVRMFGAAAIMGASVAAGRVDAYMEDGIMIWDVAASTAIVKAAGGVVDLEMINDEQCVCKLFANSELYEDYLK